MILPEKIPPVLQLYSKIGGNYTMLIFYLWNYWSYPFQLPV